MNRSIGIDLLFLGICNQNFIEVICLNELNKGKRNNRKKRDELKKKKKFDQRKITKIKEVIYMYDN